MAKEVLRTGSYMRDAESFMYDREPRFALQATMNAARIEYTEKSMTHIAGRRVDLIAISKSQAVLSLDTQYRLPDQFYLDIPVARIERIGCALMKVHPNNTIEIRFLRLLSDRDMNRIFVYSTHPDHRNVKLDIRA